MSTAVLIGTLDTKGREYDFARSVLRAAGAEVILMDVGILGDPGIIPDITAAEVAAAAGGELDALRTGTESDEARSAALELMTRGAIEIVDRLMSQGRCDGILGFGGSGGSALLSGVMRHLPFGLPKLLVSTMASGDVSSYVGSSDLCIMHSVTDIAGLNRISRPILSNAAGALAGMMSVTHETTDLVRPAVGITMLGVTTPGVLQVVARLEETGYDPVVFHAVGSGGRAMESLLDGGVLAGVIDYTIKEVTDDLHGGIFVAGPRRMRAAGDSGLPQLVVPGAVEVINFGPWDTVPADLRDGARPIIRHNDQVTAVRATRDELRDVADEVADRLNSARGPVEVVIPSGGFDSYAAHDGPFAAPEDDADFADRLASGLREGIPVTRSPLDANDPAFADLVADRFLALMEHDHDHDANETPAESEAQRS
ncbi:Tm-1-like ATP-binding domain-containing protein [Microbacterium sp. NPDC028030]|uniref:Tm-1-like ATP-binding domain-containing protein n=1 Tax=Microbacterium sp. NPDC028030 TaxID=3155124 RepID=UPI0033E20AAB